MLKITCPHCDADIDVVQDDQLLSCPSCGSRLHFLDETLLQTKDEHKVVAHFELLEQVGRGHFGDVWKARDVVLGRLVAVKIPRTSQLEHKTVQLFVREARAAAKLRHENIVSVHEVFMDDKAVYIVSDLINGVTLADQMRHKHRTPREAAELCATIAEALHYAHNNGVEAHRDVKPGNVMIDASGKPYIMDFGLAKLDAADFTMTVAGQLLGTPAYMSPEQAQGHETDRHTDIYSLGVILYELLTHARPFTGDTKLLLHQIVSEEPRAPRRINKSIPRPLETICLKALSKEPHRRYATAADFAADLRRYLNNEPVLAKPITPLERGWRWASRNPILAGLGAAAAVLLIALAVQVWDRYQKSIAGTQIVALDTSPGGAKVVFVKLDDFNRPEMNEGELVRFEARAPAKLRLPAGLYFVEAVAGDGAFHQVYRRVPAPDSDEGSGRFFHNSWEVRPDGVVQLPEITIPPMVHAIRNMTLFAGGTFTMGSTEMNDTPPHSVQIDSFYLDNGEVTVAAYRAHADPPRYNADRPDDQPVTGVLFHEALHYAELVGKRIMTEQEYEYAATERGTRQFPWGTDASRVVADTFDIQPVGQPDFDHTDMAPMVYGLFSNVTEWTDSLQIPYLDPDRRYTDYYRLALQTSRVVRGGPIDESELAGLTNGDSRLRHGPRRRSAVDTVNWHSQIGIRCARSAKPRYVK